MSRHDRATARSFEVLLEAVVRPSDLVDVLARAKRSGWVSLRARAISEPKVVRNRAGEVIKLSRRVPLPGSASKDPSSGDTVNG